MGNVRTLLLVVSLALPMPVAALAGIGPLAPQPGEEQVYEFATCAGRFSALMEHQWMVDGPESEATAQMVANMSSLVQAVLGPGQGRRALAWRIEAKLAQRALLMQADFGNNSKAVRQARMQSEILIGACRALLLG